MPSYLLVPWVRGFLAILALTASLGCGRLRIRSFEKEGCPSLEPAPQARRVRANDGYRVELRLPRRDDWRAELPLEGGMPAPEIRQENHYTLVTWRAGLARFSGRLGARKAFALRLQSQGETYPMGLSRNTVGAETGMWTLAIASAPFWVPFALPLWILPSEQAEPRLPGFSIAGTLEWRFEALPDGSHRLTVIPLEECALALLSDELVPERLSLGSACGYAWSLPAGRWKARPCLVLRSDLEFFVLHASDADTPPAMTQRGDP